MSGSVYVQLEGLGMNRTTREKSVLNAQIGLGENGSYFQVSYVKEYVLCKYMPAICWM